MPKHSSMTGVLTVLLSITGLSAQVPTKLNPKSLSLPTNTAPAFKIPAKPQVKPHPTRLTDAQYSSLRPHLAGLLKQSEGSLAPRLVQAANLWSPGSTVNVVVGQTPPTGFSWGVLGAVVTVPGACLSYANESFVVFDAYGVSPGTFLLTVYVQTNATTIQGAVNDMAFTAPVQDNMIMVPFVKTTPSNGPLTIGLKFPNAGPSVNAAFLSCDFMRIK